MKKLMNKINFAVIGILASGSAMAAGVKMDGICTLITQMHDVFQILRTLAFVGAAFTIAGWAYGYITKGEVKIDDLQKKGTGLLVGFVLLFGIGILLSALLSTAGMGAIGCQGVLTGW